MQLAQTLLSCYHGRPREHCGVKAIVRLARAQAGLSSCRLRDCGSKARSFGQRRTANCAALPTANAG